MDWWPTVNSWPSPGHRHRPALAAARLPVRGEGRRIAEVAIRVALEGVVDFRLELHLVDRRPAGSARERPDVVDQSAERPLRAGPLHPRGRPRTPFALTQRVVGGGRQLKHRPHSPDQTAGPRGREECRKLGIAHPVRPALAGGGARLIDQRQDGARDDAPLRAHAERNERLKGHRLGGLTARRKTQVYVVVKLQVGEVRERVLGQLHERLAGLGHRRQGEHTEQRRGHAVQASSVMRHILPAGTRCAGVRSMSWFLPFGAAPHWAPPAILRRQRAPGIAFHRGGRMCDHAPP